MSDSTSIPILIRVRISVVYPEMDGAQFALLVKSETAGDSKFERLLRQKGGVIVCQKRVWDNLRQELIENHKVFFKEKSDKTKKTYYSSSPKITVIDAMIDEPDIWLDVHVVGRTPFFRFPAQNIKVVLVRDAKPGNAINLD